MSESPMRSLGRAPRAEQIAAYLPLVLLCGLPFSGAASQSTDPEVTSYGGGISVSLSSTPSQRRDADWPEIFQVAPGTPLQGELGFIQSFPETKQFRVMLLLNYQQVNFAVQQTSARAGESRAPLASPAALSTAGEMRRVLEFSVPPEQEIDFDLWTEPLATGYYDLALIIVPDPYQNQRELPYFTTARAVVRGNVYVGEAEPPIVEFPLIDPEPHEDSGFTELLWFGPEPHKAGLKGEQVVEAGKEVTLTMNYQPYEESLADGLPSVTPLPVAFIAIIDDRVVPLNGQPVLYGSALPSRLSWLPVTVQVPSDPGVYQLFVQQFPNPYIDVKQAYETGRELFGQSSQRFILDAK